LGAARAACYTVCFIQGNATVTASASVVDRSTPLLKGRVRELFRHLPHALAGDEESVHQMRVAGRRLRVALPLLARSPEHRRARRARRILRELTRAAGAGRDLDVAVGLLEAEVPGGARATPAQRTLRARLRAARTRSRRRLADALLDVDIARLRRDLRRILAARGEVLFTSVLRLRDSREERGARLLEALAALGERYDVPALHEARKQVRRLRYTAEVADALLGQPSPSAGRFKELQEQLGSVRDTYMLAEWLARQARAAGVRGQSAVQAEAAELRQLFAERSRAQHRAFLERPPAERAREALLSMGPSRSSAA
jgi:CHAD domain-containing protein